jgi:small subunit ribosomal protein S6
MSDTSIRRYELLYIIPTSFTDEETGPVETKVAGLVSKYGGTVESTTRLGKLRFAYAIQDQRHGHYVLVMFTAEPQAVAKIEENLRITPEVLRHMILSAEEAGSDQKYDLVQFTEVNVDAKDDRPRRRAEGKDGEAKPEGEGKTEGEAKAEVATEASKPEETV